MKGFSLPMKHSAKAKNRVGIDIGSYSIKAVQLSGTIDKPSIVSFGIKKVSGSSKDDTHASIKALAEELKISIKEVSIGVAGPSVIVRLISMPKMSDDELASAVRFETEKFIPFDINDCVLDFQKVSKDSKEKSSVDILLAAVKKDHVLQKIKAVEEAGLIVKAVDVDILAITNAFLRNFPAQDPAKTFALLDVGASCTDVSILKGGVPAFFRQISVGSNECNAAIVKRMGVSPEEAEALKVSPGERAQEVADCTKTVLNGLIDEIKLSFGYYENQSGGGIDEVYLGGGGATIPGLDTAFQETLGSKPHYWDPFGFLDATQIPGGLSLDEKAKNTFGVAVGLALR